MKKLVFVYNSKSGFLNTVIDTLNKNLAASRYDCDLCKLTTNRFFIKSEWKNFINNLNIETQFLHKEEIPESFSEIQLPAVVLLEEDTQTVILDSEEFKKIKNLKELIQVLKNRIPDLQAKPLQS